MPLQTHECSRRASKAPFDGNGRKHACCPYPSTLTLHLGHSCSLATLGSPGTPPSGAGQSPRSKKYNSVRYWYLPGAVRGLGAGGGHGLHGGGRGGLPASPVAALVHRLQV